MNVINWIMAFFAVLGALDRILDNRFGLAEQFERGISIMGVVMLYVTGMIVVSPILAKFLQPLVQIVTNYTPIDPSVIPCMFFGNSMGGASLAMELAQNAEMGYFNGLIIASMMGITFSYIIPVMMGMVDKEYHKDVLLGLMCGIITIPVGCVISGLMLGFTIAELFWNLLPLVLFAILISIGLMKNPDFCVKIFTLVSRGLKIIVTIGLMLGIVKFLTGFEIIEGLNPFEEGGNLAIRTGAVMAGTFPMVLVLSRVLSKPLKKMGMYLHINEIATASMVSSVTSSLTAIGNMKVMDKKGRVLNAAFVVSGAYVFSSHLALVLAMKPEYTWAMMAGKLISGIAAVITAHFICEKTNLV